MAPVMKIVQSVVTALFFLPASVWVGGLVALAIATRLIEHALKGRRTEARRLVRRLRGIFQRVELIILIVLWAGIVAQVVLVKLFGKTYPGSWGTVEAILAGLLVMPTLATAYSSFYLTGAIKKREARIGSYADRNQQVRVRKNIALLLKQAEMLTWLKAVLLAGVIVAAVVALVHAQPAGGGRAPTATQPARTGR